MTGHMSGFSGRVPRIPPGMLYTHKTSHVVLSDAGVHTRPPSPMDLSSHNVSRWHRCRPRLTHHCPGRNTPSWEVTSLIGHAAVR